MLPPIQEQSTFKSEPKVFGYAPPQAWLWLNLLSLDAPLVAVVWQWLFARCFDVSLSPLVTIALALAVWFIYVSDRLLDVLRSYSHALPERHAFCYRHFKVFLAGAFMSLGVLQWICQRLEPAVVRQGLCLLGAVIVYFAVVHGEPLRFRRFWPKEFVVGLIFSAGTCLPVWSMAEPLHRKMVLPFLFFAVLCASNCLAIEYWEGCHYQILGNQQIHPLTFVVAKRLPAILPVLQFAAVFALVTGTSETRPLFASLFLSAAALFFLFRQSHRFSTPMLRVLADAVLLSPVLVWFF